MKKIYRVVKNEDFSSVVKKGHTLKNDSYTIHYLASELGYSRIGISVSSKLGHAVVRNKIKRQIRAILDIKIDYTKSSYDIVVIARSGYLEKEFSDNSILLDNLLSKITGLTNE